MDSVVTRLAEIESTTESIVAHAETQKFQVEKEIQEKRNAFDHELEVDTQEKLDVIRNNAEAKVEEILSVLRKKNQATIDALQLDFDAHHTDYAKEILQHITEV